MADLEGEIQPIMTPMVLGEATTLSPSDQHLLRLWATKTMLMLEYTDDRTRVTTLSQRRHVYRRRRPAPTTVTWISAFDERAPMDLRYFHRTARLGDVLTPAATLEEERPNTQLTVFVLGRLVLAVASTSWPLLINIPLRFGSASGAMRRITTR
jgi:hypothetical protein